MAEKNTESTAVNQLIELVATAQPLPPDPDEDLMFRPVSKETKAPEPLPRARAPIGTQQNHTVKQVPPGVRITTPSRSMTIPPMTLDHDEDAEVTNPGPSFARPTSQGVVSQPRATGSNAARLSGVHAAARATLPPPVPTMRPTAQTMRASSPPPAIPFRPSSQPTTDFSYPVLPNLPPPHRATSMPAVTLDDDEPHAPEESTAAPWLEREVGTQQVPKHNDWKTIAGKLVGPMVVLVITGIFIGGYFAFDGDGGKKRTPKPAIEGEKVAMAVTPPAPAAVETDKSDAPITPPNLAAATPAPEKPVEPPVEPAKAVEPAVEPVKAAEPAKAVEPTTPTPSPVRPTLVDVRIDSNPSGATVMLIDRGKQTFLGTTPMSAAVDVARKYELVFSHAGRATVVESLDPKSQKKLSVKLSRPSAPKAAAPKVAAPKVAALETADKKPVVEKVEKAPAGDGTLMISSKPPCEIYVDGKPTGLTTPQRAIMLPAGAHKVTLVNTAQGIKKTLSVQITADKPTKVIQDFMK